MKGGRRLLVAGLLAAVAAGTVGILVASGRIDLLPRAADWAGGGARRTPPAPARSEVIRWEATAAACLFLARLADHEFDDASASAVTDGWDDLTPEGLGAYVAKAEAALGAMGAPDAGNADWSALIDESGQLRDGRLAIILRFARGSTTAEIELVSGPRDSYRVSAFSLTVPGLSRPGGPPADEAPDALAIAFATALREGRAADVRAAANSALAARLAETDLTALPAAWKDALGPPHEIRPRLFSSSAEGRRVPRRGVSIHLSHQRGHVDLQLVLVPRRDGTWAVGDCRWAARTAERR